MTLTLWPWPNDLDLRIDLYGRRSDLDFLSDQGHFCAHRGQSKGHPSQSRSSSERGWSPLFEKLWFSSVIRLVLFFRLKIHKVILRSFLGFSGSSAFNIDRFSKIFLNPLFFCKLSNGLNGSEIRRLIKKLEKLHFPRSNKFCFLLSRSNQRSPIKFDLTSGQGSVSRF